MSNGRNALIKPYLAITAIVTWFGLLLQFFVLINHAEHALVAIGNYFSYFTILTNLLVTVSSTVSLLIPGSSAGKFFSTPSVKAATALYIFVVGVIYNLVLKQLWDPKGWQLIADLLLHTVVPVLCTGYWLFLVQKGLLAWKNTLNWLLYPLLYSVYSLVRGSVTGWYPYPFIDVNSLGYHSVLLNMLMLAAAFLILGMLVVLLDRYLGKISAKNK